MTTIALGLVVLLSVLQSTNALSCIPCKQVKCRYLDPRDCEFGVTKDACGCCDICRKCVGEPCWDAEACAKGLHCVRGKCQVPKPRNCDLAGCSIPTKCPLGMSTPKDSCCPVCKVGPESKCGNRIADCAVGLTCQNGICIPKGCSKPIDCRTAPCPAVVLRCEHGIGYGKCSCCQSCIVGEGECCKPDGGPCADGLKCIGGKCCKNNSDPPPKDKCALLKCLPKNCQFGSSTLKGSSCPVCKVGCQSKCGHGIADCATGLTCQNGICVPKGCSKPKDCRKDVCKVFIQECKHGMGFAKCSCCPTCIVGEGESCKPDGDPCADGLKCIGGKCCKNNSEEECSRPKNCNLVRCALPYCTLGVSTPRCSCCPACKVGPGFKCGDRFADCAYGLTCRNGICIHKRCSRKVDCRTALCPAVVLKCKHEIGFVKCSCCPSCILEDGESCTPDGAPCMDGLKCIGGKCCTNTSETGRPHSKKCPKKPCPLLRCTHGSGKGRYQDCPICRREVGQSCGDYHGLCVAGLTCEYRHDNERGTCVEKRTECSHPFKCIGVRCIKLATALEAAKDTKSEDKPANVQSNLVRFCRYGIGRAPCQCCSTCLKDSGEDCGDNIGLCRSGYSCKNIRGKKTSVCVWDQVKECSRPKNCHLVDCSVPQKCLHGISTPKCSCCPACKAAPGSKCGKTFADCATGLSCQDGICIHNKCDKKPMDCSTHRCLYFPTNCKFGAGYGRCSCCASCVLENGESCKPYGAPCQDGLKCIDGKCCSNNSPCANLNCDGVKCCKPQNCEYGYGAAPCKCCAYCLKGPNDSCGEMQIPCGRGLSCINTSRSVPRYQCIRTRPGSCHDCKLVRCVQLDARSCPYGAGLDPCGCCSVCLKGFNDKCGGRYGEHGRCSPAFVCNAKIFGEPGVCVCGEDYVRTKDEL